MGKYFFIVCALILVFGIWQSKGIDRLLWFFTGILFFQHRIVLFTSPTVMSFHRLLIFALLIPELINLNKLRSELKEFPLRRPLLLTFLGLMIIGLFDNRLTPVLKFYRPLDLFIQTFFVTFLCYINFKKNEDWKKVVKFFLVSSIILCVYGLYNYITKSNPIDTYISNSFNAYSSFDFYSEVFDERFRINSFTDHPIYYGYLLGLIFILLFSELLDQKNKINYLIALAFVFGNLILTNSRTPFLSFFLGVIVYAATAFSTRTKIKFIFLGLLIGVCIYSVPLIKDKINNTIDIFQTGGSELGGSSLTMRKKQMEASMQIFRRKPILGNGIYFIEENLGYSSDEDKSNSADDLQGFESYIYIILIEQGFLGCVVNVFFFGGLIIFFLKRRQVSRKMAALGITVTTMFLLFSIGTGTLGSWIITMGLLGIIIKNIEIDKSLPFDLSIKG